MTQKYRRGNDWLPACVTKMISETTVYVISYSVENAAVVVFKRIKKNPFCKISIYIPQPNLLIRTSFSIGRIIRNVPTCVCR